MMGARVRQPYPWKIFGVLFGAGLLATLALLPYLGELSRRIAAHTERPVPHLGIVQIVLALFQSAIFLAFETGFGLLLASRVGLTVPLLSAWLYGRYGQRRLWSVLFRSIVAGLLSASIAVGVLVWVFVPRIPQILAASEYQYPLWKRFLAALYGGIAEEILMRLFVMTLLVWLLSRILHEADGLPSPVALWASNIIAAVLFGLGHLPMGVALGIPVNALVIADAVTVNGVIGATCGWLYINWGFEGAMIAHFCADVVLHVIGPYFVH